MLVVDAFSQHCSGLSVFFEVNEAAFLGGLWHWWKWGYSETFCEQGRCSDFFCQAPRFSDRTLHSTGGWKKRTTLCRILASQKYDTSDLHWNSRNMPMLQNTKVVEGYFLAHSFETTMEVSNLCTEEPDHLCVQPCGEYAVRISLMLRMSWKILLLLISSS